MTDWQDILIGEMRIEKLLGLPHASHNPAPYRHQLAYDAFALMSRMGFYRDDLEKQLESPRLTRLAREKVKKALSDYQKHIQIMAAHLAPLEFNRISVPEFKSYSSHKKVGDRLIDYYINIARDWAWGVEENLTGLRLIQAKFQEAGADQKSIKRVLAVGAGACRLPYELHRWLRPELTLCVDYNPLLLSVAQKLISGKPLDHVDFPNVPLDGDSFTVPYKLTAPEPLGPEFGFLVHDLSEWGFREAAFDLILTPWIVDMVPALPPRFFAQINSALKPGGHWVNYGPLNFSRLRMADNWTLKEILRQVEKSGFTMSGHDYSRVPHLQNPHSAHGRLDYVLTFCAQKTQDCEIPADMSAEALPDWATDPNSPVEIPLAQKELQASLHFAHELSQKVNKGLTLPELAAFMSAQHGIGFDEAETLIRNTLLGWAATPRFNPMR